MSAISSLAKLTVGLLLAGVTLPAQQVRAPAASSAPDLRITGIVVSSADGQPLSHAQVTLSSTSNRDFVVAGLTGNDGRFVFSGLTPGKYVLAAEHPGFVHQGYQQHGFFFTGIAVGPGLATPHLLFRLQPEAIISGRVFDEAGDPVRDARVMLLYRSLQNGRWGTRLISAKSTDDRGIYHFGRLLPGRYFVAVQTQPWYARSVPLSRMGTAGKLEANTGRSPLDVVYPITYYQDVTDPDDATAVDVQAGDQASADVTLTAVPAQHIIVRAPDVADNSGITAMLSQRMSEASTISLSAGFNRIAPGVFESTGVPPGNYQMELNFYNPKSGQSVAAQSRTVDVGNTQDSQEVDLSQAPLMATVVGSVRFIPPEKPPQHLAIMLTELQSHQTSRAEVSSRGKLTFAPALPPGQYQILSNFVDGFYISSVAATGANLQGRILRITTADPVRLRLTMSRGVAQVKGTALRNGKPESEALVVLVPSDPEDNPTLFRADQSDSDGSFTLPAVVPGKYTVIAVANGWSLEWRTPAVLKPYLAHGEVLEIAPQARYNIKPRVQDF